MTDEQLQFREFFIREYERLCRLGLLLTGDAHLGEELAQDALVRTFWAWPRVRRMEQPSAYARQILVNRRRSLLRRRLVEATHAWRLRREEVDRPNLGEEAMVLWAAIRKLPERQRMVLVLRYHEDLSEAEVARLLHLSVGAVKALTHRGISRLRVDLGRAADEQASIPRREGP